MVTHPPARAAAAASSGCKVGPETVIQVRADRDVPVGREFAGDLLGRRVPPRRVVDHQHPRERTGAERPGEVRTRSRRCYDRRSSPSRRAFPRTRRSSNHIAWRRRPYRIRSKFRSPAGQPTPTPSRLRERAAWKLDQPPWLSRRTTREIRQGRSRRGTCAPHAVLVDEARVDGNRMKNMWMELHGRRQRPAPAAARGCPSIP